MPGLDHIRVRGATQNNLAGIDVDLPKHQLTVFTGVSGSGKSSLVFGTVAAESQRLINETYSAFLQAFMPTMDRPDVDVLEGLTAAIIVDQERMGANARSTVGTATDANALLRILFSRLGTPQVGPPRAFAFNVPSITASGAATVHKTKNAKAKKQTFTALGGMCPGCEGMGTANDIDVGELVDESKSLRDGAITVPGYNADGWYVRIFAAVIPDDKPIAKLTKKQRQDFLYGEPRKVKLEGANMTFEGLVPKIQKSYLSKDPESLQPHIRRFVERAVTFTTCPDCDGTRLAEHARRSKVGGINIAEACQMQVTDLAAWVAGLDEPSAAPLLSGLAQVLDAMVDIGLGYLSLDRPTGTLSGGEAQRTKMVRHLGSALTDVTYVFDEPTAGLHAHDVARMVDLLEQLRDKGNTVLVVEHEPDVIVRADHVVDMGPGAGTKGGTIVYEGDVKGLRRSGTRTGDHLDTRAPIKTAVREPTGKVAIKKASLHNLKNVSVDIPTGVLVCVTGVAGSGKSSLVHGCLPRTDDMVFVDQSPIKGSSRSNPATYTGMFDHIRKAFAKANDVKPALFSFNSEGACEACNGAGVITTDLGAFSTVETTCELCEGRRYNDEVLEHKLRGRDIVEVLAMSVDEALEHFEEKPVVAMLGSLSDVGLGYLSLGQALNTLSGGERQRLRLAMELAGDATFYILDEPSSGLHMADVDRLVELLDRMVEEGRTVVVVEHDLDVIARADWVIDLGPGAGHDGGTVVFEGPPAALAKAKGSLTGKHLAADRALDPA